jgi:hypothetical protein
MPTQPQSLLTATRSVPASDNQAVVGRPAVEALFVRLATGVPLKKDP